MRCGNWPQVFNPWASQRFKLWDRRGTQFCTLPLLLKSDQFHTFKSIIWLKILQCAPEAATILSQDGAEKHQRNSISVLVELLCTLESRLFSAGASRILVHALHATRLGRTNFPCAMDLFPWLCDFCEFLHAQLVSRLCALPWSPWRLRRLVVLAYSTFPLNFSHSALHNFHFGFWLDCSTIWWCIQAHFLPNSQEDRVVQLPFRPALRLRLFSNGMLAPCFIWTFPPIIFLVAFRWNLKHLDTLILWIHSFWKSLWIPVDGIFRNQKLELKIEKLFGILAIWLKIGRCLDHHFLSRVSPCLLAPEYFP